MRLLSQPLWTPIRATQQALLPIPDPGAPFLRGTATNTAKRRKRNKARSPPLLLPHPALLPLPSCLCQESDQGAGDLLLFLRFFRQSGLIHQVSAWDPGNPAPCVNTGKGPRRSLAKLGCRTQGMRFQSRSTHPLGCSPKWPVTHKIQASWRSASPVPTYPWPHCGLTRFRLSCSSPA